LNKDEKLYTERLIVKISIGCDILPVELVIEGDHCIDVTPALQGGFSQIYRATLEGKEVAMKLVAVGSGPDPPEDILRIRRVIRSILSI
jgi:hypothetical protein